MDYAVPRAGDMPAVEIDNLCTPAPTNVLGAKGVGEADSIGGPAALYNAVADAFAPLDLPEHALNAALEFPLTAARLWLALSSGSAK